MTTRQKYYPWVIMAACCFFIGVGMGIGTNCNGIFMQPVADSLGVGRGDVSAFVTVMGIAGAATAPFVGSLINKIDIRKLLTMSVMASGLGFMALSLIDSLWQYCLIGAVIGVGVGLGSFMTVTVILNNWFVKNVGLVIGITLSSSSLVGIVMNPVLNNVIQSYGWRSAYRLMGALMLCALPIIWGLIRMHPSQKGSQPWGADDIKSQEQGLADGGTEKIPAKGLLASAPFLMMIAFAFICSFFVNHTGHLQGIATAAGFSAGIGASMISMAQAGEFTGKLAIGYLSDRFGVLKAFYVVAMLGACGIVGMMFLSPSAPLLALACAFAYGPMTAVGSVGYSLIVKNMFGTKLYPRCYPYISITSTISFSVGFPVIGYIYDATGSYVPSLIMTLSGLALAVAVLTAGMKMTSKKAVPQDAA